MPIAIKEFFPPKIASRDTTTGNNTIYVFDGAEEKSFEDGMRRSVKEARSMSKLEAYEGIGADAPDRINSSRCQSG